MIFFDDYDHEEQDYGDTYDKKLTLEEIKIIYKDNEYFVDVTYEIVVRKDDGKITIENVKLDSFVVQDENGEVDLPKQDILPLIPPLSEKQKEDFIDDLDLP